MRKIFLLSTGVLLILSIVLLGFGITRKVQKRRAAAEMIARLPAFSFFTLDNRVFNLSDIRNGPVLVMYFHPECEHCQWEVGQIFEKKIPDSFQHVLLVSTAHPDSIRKFLNQFSYSAQQTVTALKDTLYNFEQYFGSSMIPSSYVYDRDLNLIKEFHGEIKGEAILELVLNHDQ
jgi:hypothetical protein